MSKHTGRGLALVLVLALLAASCGGSDNSNDDRSSGSDTTDTTGGTEIDYAAIGLWDDGPCDEARPAADRRYVERVRVAGHLVG